MGRSGSALVAAAVAALGVAAVVDAVVGGAPPPPRRAPPPPPAEPARGADPYLEAEGVSGRLLYVDEGCTIRTIALPRAERREAPGRRACSFTSSPGGNPGADGAVVSPRWPTDPYAAACADGRVELHTLAGGQGYAGPLLGPVVERVRGCAPAWRPDGRLTLVRDGQLVDVGRRPGEEAARVVLSRRDVARAFTGSPWEFVDPAVAEAAWLGDELVAVVVRNREGGDVLALFRDGRFVASTPSPYDRLVGLRASPRGTYVAARIDDAPALVLLDRGGDFVPTGLRGHAIAWSPDDAWAAVAAPDAIYVFEAGSRASRFARIEVTARDVFWR